MFVRVQRQRQRRSVTPMTTLEKPAVATGLHRYAFCQILRTSRTGIGGGALVLAPECAFLVSGSAAMGFGKSHSPSAVNKSTMARLNQLGNNNQPATKSFSRSLMTTPVRGRFSSPCAADRR